MTTIKASRSAATLARVTLVCTLAACASTGGAGGSSGSADSSRELQLSGYVLRSSDSAPVKGANVWTAPASDNTVTDSTGYWQVSLGLVPGTYIVNAELATEKGTVPGVPIDLNRPNAEGVVILLGTESTAWPPPKILAGKVPALQKTGGPGPRGP